MNTASYTLMHKNIPVTDISIEEITGAIVAVYNTQSFEHLPIGVHCTNGFINQRELSSWWYSRSIPASRLGLQELLYTMNIHSPKALLTKSMGLSLSDQYWIKPVNSNVKWREINFFDNPFSEDMGNILLGDIHPSASLDLCSPDNTSDGYLKKRWKIINDKRCLIKSGELPFYQQPINEKIASIVMERLGITHVPYSLLWKKGKPYSVCEDFISSETELVSAQRVMSIKPKANHHNTYTHYVTLCKENGIDKIEHSLDEMIVIDYIIANEDRHFNNFGIIRNADTLKWLRAAPIFDSGSSLGYNKPSSNLYKDMQCKPFKKSHNDQLKLVTSFDWVDFSKLNGIENDISDILSDKRITEYIDTTRRNAIVDFVTNRIYQLENTAKNKSPITSFFVSKKRRNDLDCQSQQTDSANALDVARQNTNPDTDAPGVK